MRRYLGRRSRTWWLVWAVATVCLVAGQLMARPNALHGLGVLLIWGLIAYEVARLIGDVWRLVTR